MVHQPSEDAYMSLRYNDLLAPMIKAIQQLDSQHGVALTEKEQQIVALQAQLKAQQQAHLQETRDLRAELAAVSQSQQEQTNALQAQLARLTAEMSQRFAGR